MGLLKKLLGRERTHEQWLEAHPDKGAPKTGSVAFSTEEKARTRATMEEGMKAQREKRQS
jgi:hypothetical protein